MDVLLLDGLRDELLGDAGRLAVLDSPADHIATEHVEDDVQVVVGPLRRTEQFADIPTPDFVRLLGQQLRLGVGGVGELVAALAGFARGRSGLAAGGRRRR